MCGCLLLSQGFAVNLNLVCIHQFPLLTAPLRAISSFKPCRLRFNDKGVALFFAGRYALIMEMFLVFGQVERKHACKDKRIILARSYIDAIGLRQAKPLL